MAMMTPRADLPRLMYLADLRYRLYAQEGGNIHIRAMMTAFGEFAEVVEPACPVAMSLLRRSARHGRPKNWNKLLETLALAIGACEKALAYARQRPALVYARHEIWEVPALVLLKGLGARLALEVNGIVSSERSINPAGRLLERLAFRVCDRAFCVSAFLSAQLRDAGVPALKLVVTHNAIHPADFPPLPAASAGRPLIGFVGTNQRRHGLPVLVEAFADLCASHPHASMLIIGPSSPELEATVRSLNLEGRIEITGHLPHHAALEACRRLDIAVLPDAAPHNSPLKLFEYMALGKAVVAARTPAVAEVLTDGETGLLVEPGSRSSLSEALSTLLDDAALRERLGARARAAVLSRHTWRHNALTVLERVAPELAPA